MAEFVELEKEEFLYSRKPGKHTIKDPIKLVERLLGTMCICPKLSERKPCDNIFPEKINEILNCYKIKTYKFQGQGVFEFPKGADLIRPYYVNKETYVKYQGSKLIRPSEIIFKGVLNFPNFFTEEEKSKCECYPFVKDIDGRKHFGTMFKIGSEINQADESFYDLYKTNDRYDCFEEGSYVIQK